MELLRCECGETLYIEHEYEEPEYLLFYIECLCGKETKRHFYEQDVIKEWNSM